MKRLFLLMAAFLILTSVFFYSRTMLFLYENPYTNTSGLKKISTTIKELSKGFNYTQNSASKQGCEFKYLFWNAYGSGFLKNNPIPNDLDFAVGIDLGEYNYDGENADKIAEELVNKIQAFQTSFIFYINTMREKEFYTSKSQIEMLNYTEKARKNYQKCIKESLNNALSGNNYIIYTTKNLEENDKTSIINVPYLMRPYEILLEDFQPIIVYSSLVAYNSKMPRYMREISIIPEFFVTINQNGQKRKLELVPESYVGDRLQLSRKFFASNVYIGNFSEKFLKNLEFMKNDDEYLFYRMFSYRRHFQEVENIAGINDRPIKLFKRIMQTADIIYPMLSEETYNEISEYVAENLSDNTLQLLNEYENICKNIIVIMESPKLYLALNKNGSIETMYNTASNALEYLNACACCDKELLQKIQNFHQNELKAYLNCRNQAEVINNKEKLIEKYDSVSLSLHSLMTKQIKNPEKINKYEKIFNKIYTDAGYHKVCICWLDKNLAGIVEDDFTRTIKDLRSFASSNELADVNYKFIKESEIPTLQLKYDVWVRYNPTEDEEKNYNTLKNKLINDKKNFYIRKKLIFTGL